MNPPAAAHPGAPGHESPPGVDYSRKWYAMAAVAMGIFLATIDGSIVNIALPTLVSDLETTFAAVQWVVLAYLLTLATLLLSVGRLADIRGKRTIYVTGFLVFTAGSVLCGLAWNVYGLILMRVLQAVGAAMVLALGPAIITEAFPPSERGRALGITGSVVSVGIVIGPALGGVILSNLSWHWIFFVNLPIGLLGSYMAWRFVPAVQPRGAQRFDFLGAGLLCLSLLAFLFALTLGQDQGFTDSLVLGLLGAWLILFGLFVIVERRVAQPMIDLNIFRNAQFSLNLVTGFITFAAIAGVILLMPFYLETILGYPVQQVGLLLAVVPIALGITAPISGSLSDRLGSRVITISGLTVLVIAYLAVSTLSLTTTALGYVVRLFPIGLGMGIFQSPNNSAIMGAVPRERLGIASGLLSLTRTLGQTTGIAIFGAIWASRVAFYAGGSMPGGATTAPAEAQVQALQDTALFTALLVAVGLALGLWAWHRERRTRAARLQSVTDAPK
jgi:EmrB/QacA subfamily drug resistance transporter